MKQSPAPLYLSSAYDIIIRYLIFRICGYLWSANPHDSNNIVAECIFLRVCFTRVMNEKKKNEKKEKRKVSKKKRVRSENWISIRYYSWVNFAMRNRMELWKNSYAIRGVFFNSLLFPPATKYSFLLKQEHYRLNK